eukprot:GEMP01042370.1.p1 GENE.GEMP01042370.1~~GEMP01042370.1.p1  ORF type:complete len:425 (+),score=59.73 GEMP01042370.1:213-1487(+)
MIYDSSPYFPIQDDRNRHIVPFTFTRRNHNRWTKFRDVVTAVRAHLWHARCILSVSDVAEGGPECAFPPRAECGSTDDDNRGRRRGGGFYLIAGIAVLMPFNVIILTFDQFQTFQNWPFQCMVAYCLPIFFAQIVGQYYPPTTIWRPLGCLTCACACMPLLLHFSVPIPVGHVCALCVVTLTALSSAFSQLAIFGRGARDNKGLAVSIGTGLAGPVSALCDGSVNGYLVAAAICFLCAYWSEYDSCFEGKTDIVPAFMSPLESSSAASTIAETPLLRGSLAKGLVTERPLRMHVYAITIWFTYLLSGFCFPGKIDHWLPRVVAYYQVWDFIGRCIPMICKIPWSIAPPMAIIRALFAIPVIATSLPPLMTYEFKLVLVAAFAFTNGFLTSLTFARSAASPPLGRLLSLSICFGLSTGSVLAMTF